MIEIRNEGAGVFVIKIKIPEVHTLDVPDLKDRLNQAITEKNITSKRKCFLSGSRYECPSTNPNTGNMN